jgi:dihydroorotase-like cyclic amidohydrolase
MSNFSLVLKNCNLVNEDSISAVDIGINNDRIEKIASQITSQSDEIIDL